MTTAKILEIIQPGFLHAPSDAVLSIGSAGFPNGDDTLIIDGVTDNFRAYQPAIDGIHYSSDPTLPMTIVFWCNPNISGSSGTSNIKADGLLFGVMDINLALANVTTTSPTAGFAWAVSVGTTGTHNKNFVYHRSVGASARNNIRWVDTTSNDLIMYAIRDPGNGSATVRVNGNSAPNTTHISNAGAQGTPGALANPKFAIGPYSTISGWRFPPSIIDMGKITIWMGILLTDEDLVSLYDSMINGPASPPTLISVTVDVAPGQADPATGGFVTFRVVFSESVTGFTDSDVVISGTAGATSCFITGGAGTYDVSVSGMTTPGTVVIDIPAGSVTAVGGGTNLESVAIDNSIDWS